jgi:hypothetical protein
LRGHSLRRIETAMKRMELSPLTKLPSGQRALIADGQPVVLGIEVLVAKVRLLGLWVGLEFDLAG